MITGHNLDLGFITSWTNQK